MQVDSFPIDPESIEVPESYSDSTINEDEDASINYEDEDDGDEEETSEVSF